jgi:TolA-binding protein
MEPPLVRPQLILRQIDRLGRGYTALACCAVLGLFGCSVESAKKNYVLAESLWSDGKYAAAVGEFEKVTTKDPAGKLGTMALYRSAMTQAYFLSQYPDALRKLQRFVEVSSDPSAKWEAQKLIGEILFSRLEQYDLAMQHYKSLVSLKPEGPEVPEFLFRIGQSHFFLRQFNEAIESYQELNKKFPQNPWGERAAYEIGVTSYTRGGRSGAISGKTSDSYQEAIDAFERFIRSYPKSEWAVQAKFHIAASLEEMDQLDVAYRSYEALKAIYPSPKVIQIKMIRIRERQAQRSR